MGRSSRHKAILPEPPLASSRSLLLQFNHTIKKWTPVEVGTRGTVGSLVMKEIEYFSRLELDRHGSGSSQRSQAHVVDVASGSTGRSRHRFWFLIMTWRRKKRRSSRTFLPSICSVVEVADSHRLNGIPGFNYRILKDDVPSLLLMLPLLLTSFKDNLLSCNVNAVGRPVAYILPEKQTFSGFSVEDYVFHGSPFLHSNGRLIAMDFQS
ncbi:hypothetical protein AAG906_001947 [Vitis piasezkii]